jgi:hypothetical protein
MACSGRASSGPLIIKVLGAPLMPGVGRLPLAFDERNNMRATDTEVGALLLKWRDSRQPLTILFSSEAENWERSGKIVSVLFAKFEVVWDDGNSQFISYAAIPYISDDGQSLNLRYSSGDSVVVYEKTP